jgi:hypothetical protein
VIVIPVLNEPAQKFDILLEGTIWTFYISYSSLDELWYMGIEQNAFTLCSGVKMVSGMDLVRAFNIMQGQLVVVVGDDYNQDPTIGAWGRGADFLYFSPEDVANILASANEQNLDESTV